MSAARGEGTEIAREPATAGLSPLHSQTLRKVGHDLRNKLGVMRNSVYYLNMKVGGQSEKLAKHLGILSREIETSTRTLASLMDYLSPKAPMAAAIDLNDLLRRAISAKETEVQAIWHLREGLAPAWGDGAQIEAAIEALWAYELATLRPGDKVRVVSGSAGDALTVELIDSGPGLSAQELAELLDPLADSSTGSLHLGLSVAREAVIRNGGSWAIESSLGNGSRISLQLPTSPDPSL